MLMKYPVQARKERRHHPIWQEPTLNTMKVRQSMIVIPVVCHLRKIILEI